MVATCLDLRCMRLLAVISDPLQHTQAQQWGSQGMLAWQLRNDVGILRRNSEEGQRREADREVCRRWDATIPQRVGRG